MTYIPNEEDVLDAFAAESDHGAATFQHYLREYPQFASALIDLSRELLREIPEDRPLSDKEIAWVDEAVMRYAAVPRFASPTIDQCRAAARELRVPRQVITAILECKVAVETISQRTLGRLAAQFDATLEGMIEAISGPPTSVSRRYKADGKPSVGEKAPLERVLRQAGVEEDIITNLLSKEN